MDQTLKKKWLIHQVVATVIFFIGLAACYQGVLRGLPYLGPVTILLLAVIKFSVQKERRSEVTLVAIVTVLSFILESLLISIGIYTPAPGTRFIIPAPLAPFWILALWVNFALRIKDYMWFMKGKPVVHFVTGFVFGLIIFNSVNRLGLGTLNYGIVSLFIGSFIWGAFIPVLYYIADKLLNRTTNFETNKEQV